MINRKWLHYIFLGTSKSYDRVNIDLKKVSLIKLKQMHGISDWCEPFILVYVYAESIFIAGLDSYNYPNCQFIYYKFNSIEELIDSTLNKDEVLKRINQRLTLD